jgi:uncharacterized protein (TIGR02444 family)
MRDDSTQLEASLRARLAAAPLWEFALAFYERTGVEAACLHLQDDAGVDVCELLWCCWLFRHGAMPIAECPELMKVRRWQQEVTLPLRRLRRQLKAESHSDPGIAELRRTLQRAELQAERESLNRLEAVTLSSLLPSTSSPWLVPLPPLTHPSLENQLATTLQLEKKSHLGALRALESQLDPSSAPV